MSIIFHIDVNSAYLSWSAVEQLKNGAETDLREIPAIIGGDQKSRHGVVLAKSVPAKKYGIRTGEPVANAFRKCPNLVSVPPDHKMYSRYSHALMDFLKTYTPDIEQVSVDECYMDFTGIVNRFVSPVEGAMEIKNEVYRRFGFTVNVGISSNKLLAKMASDFEKPNKVHTLFPEEIQVKMWPLPIGELYMVGRSVRGFLNEARPALHPSAPDLRSCESPFFHLKSHGRKLWEFANGIDGSQVEAERAEAKGIGNSTTLAQDVVTEEEASNVLYRLAESVGARLRKAGQRAGMLSVEIKYYNFETCSHQKQLFQDTNSDRVIHSTAMELFRELWNGEPIRLLGIRSSKLSDEGEPQQLSIFDIQTQKKKKKLPTRKQEQLDKALDQIRKRYGESSVVRGSSLSSLQSSISGNQGEGKEEKREEKRGEKRT